MEFVLRTTSKIRTTSNSYYVTPENAPSSGPLWRYESSFIQLALGFFVACGLFFRVFLYCTGTRYSNTGKYGFAFLSVIWMTSGRGRSQVALLRIQQHNQNFESHLPKMITVL